MLRYFTFSFICLAMAICCASQGQLTVNAGQLFIQSGAVIAVEGNIEGSSDILGPGKILLNGSANQNIHMGGFTIPVLEINNVAHVTLTGNLRVGTSLVFTNGKIKMGNSDFTLSNMATFSGAGNNKFLETTGSGKVYKEISSNLPSLEIPLGAGSSYRPAFLTTSGTYSNAKIGIQVKAAASPNKPPKLSDFINVYWPVTRAGITGSVIVKGEYINASDVTGSEANLRGYYFNGTDWNSASETHNVSSNQVSAPVTSNSGELSALNKFDLVNAKIFLQGAFNSTTGLMNDGLRTPANVIPFADPYRASPYTSQFTHIANSTSETAAASVFNNQLPDSNNIVDWVFLELRNNMTPTGNTVIQTRSALLQRDGDIVDIDGVSPVTFNNVASGNYTIAVRHRNHLGVSTNPASITPALGEAKSTASVINFTTFTDAQVFGSSSAYVITGGKNLLWAGDANGNGQSKYQGPSNDRATILSALGNNELGTKNGYERSDINLNGQVKYQGPSNDRAIFLSSVLAGAELVVRSQELPN